MGEGSPILSSGSFSDRKSYDHLIKLKSEYGGSLSWVLPYPGDWHILFFNLIFYLINFFSKLSHAKVSSPISLKSSKLKWENLLPLMGEDSPILSSGSFSDLIKAVFYML
jgi:hypothetical protein